MAKKKTTRLLLSEHTLDINPRRYSVVRFDFRDVEEYVRALTGEREYQYQAIKEILIYLWGGSYSSVTELAEENFPRKPALQHRFQSIERLRAMLPLPDRLSGVCHMATGTGKSYVMFAVAHLSLLLGKVKRVLVLGPSSTVIEQGLRDKFKEYLYGEMAARLRDSLPPEHRHKAIHLLTCNDPVQDSSIVVENINAIYGRETNSLGDTLFAGEDAEVLVLSDEVHHAYSHLSFSGVGLGYDFAEGKEGQGDERNERLWMKFLREEPRIARHIGFTGTPYNQNDYFVDVIFNYSIPEALDARIIKRINPILKTETDEVGEELTLAQKFEQILLTHAANRARFSYRVGGKATVKPITIFINPTQAMAKTRTEEFVQVLGDYLARTPEGAGKARSEREQMAREMVICVISKAGDAEYAEKLRQIEEVDPAKPGGKVEFIFAVNKLSEGWDVDNVFQIVPMDERTFNSKLLISQVLGRGLRIPRRPSHDQIMATFPEVTVTNHEKFAGHIRELLDEVTECETRLASRPLGSDAARSRHHFALFHLEYEAVRTTVDRDDPPPEINRKLLLEPTPEKLGLKVTYLRGEKRFELTREYCTFDQLVLDIEQRFKVETGERNRYDFGDGHVCDHPERDDIERVIRRAMEQAGIEGDRISQRNRQQIELFFNQYLPRGTKKVVWTNSAGTVRGLSTAEMRQATTRSGNLHQDATVFLTEDYATELERDNLFAIEELRDGQKQPDLDDSWLESQAPYNRDLVRQLVSMTNLFAANTSAFHSPQGLVIVSHDPERDFVFRLIEHHRYVHSWVKSPDSDFYGLFYEYWKGGKDRTRRTFNPDFFLRIELASYIPAVSAKAGVVGKKALRQLQDQGIEDVICVVEIKCDEDYEDETTAKERYGREHFQQLNERLRTTNPAELPEHLRQSANQHYVFSLLRPADYPEWFSRLEHGMVIGTILPSSGTAAATEAVGTEPN